MLDIDRIDQFLAWFGFGETTGIDLPMERKGIRPARHAKYQRYKYLLKKQPEIGKWYKGDTVSIGIGQGYITATPLQLAVATATLAMHGKMMQPRLLYAIRESRSKQ